MDWQKCNIEYYVSFKTFFQNKKIYLTYTNMSDQPNNQITKV